MGVQGFASLLLLLLACLASSAASIINYDSSGGSTRFVEAQVPGLNLSIAGGVGGYANGPFETAKFNQPQSAALVRGANIMLVADTMNQARAFQTS